jgi:putative hydrolase of the HAD superfamily
MCRELSLLAIERDLKRTNPGTPAKPGHNPPGSMLFSDVKAVFFDLDDTLCGYWDAAKTGLDIVFTEYAQNGTTPSQLKKAWANEFRTFAKEVKSDAWYERYCRDGGSSRTELMRRTLAAVDADTAQAEEISTRYLEERQNALHLFEGSLETLQALKGKYPLGLITNGPGDIQRLEIEKLGISDFFDSFHIEGEMGYGKPDPRVFTNAENAANARGPENLMVGNSAQHDIKPAQQAGWHTAWVRRPSDVSPSSRTGRQEELPVDMAQPDFILADLRALLDHLA